MDEILNLIESVSEGFPSYFYLQENPYSDLKTLGLGFNLKGALDRRTGFTDPSTDG